MSDERPSDALQKPAKRRNQGGRDRDDPEEDDQPSVDPGAWTADATATRERRKVHVRRGAGGGGAAAQPAANNPFAGVAFSFGAPPAAPAAAGPVPAPAAGEAAPKATEQAADKSQVEGKPADGEGAEKAAAAPEAKPAEEAAAGETAKAEETGKPASDALEPPAAEDAKQPDAAAAAPAAQESKPAAEATPGGAATPSAGIFGGSAGTTSGFASLAAGNAGATPFNLGGFGASGTTPGGLFGTAASGGGIFGTGGAAGGLFGGAGGAGVTPAFGGFTFPKLDTTAGGLGKPLFGATAACGAGPEGGEGAEEKPDAFEPSEDPSIKPVVQLAVVQKVTGEEDEQMIYAENGKLYEYDSAASKWRERGSGELRVNVSADGAISRMLMRQSGNLRLLLNARILSNMAVQRMQGASGVTFGCVNTASLDPSQSQQQASAAAPADASTSSDKADDKDATGAGKAAGPSLMRTWAFRTKGEEKILGLLAALEKAKAEHSNPQEERKDEAAEAEAAV